MVCEKCKPEFDLLLKRIESLERRLAAYENAHTPPSQQRKKRLPPSSTKLGAPKGHPGTTRPQSEPTMSLEVIKESCDYCSTQLGEPFKVERRVIEEIPEPQPIEVTEYRIGHYQCATCGKVSTADIQAPPGRFGARACAHIALLKFGDRLPHRLVTRALQRQFGMQIAPATVLDVSKRVADAVRHQYDALVEKIRSSAYVHVDETPLRVGGRTYYVWIFSTTQETVYVIRPSRGKIVPAEILAGYTGVIITDGYKVYPDFGSAQQRCWAHLLREAKELAEKHSTAEGLYAELKKMHKDLSTVLKKPLEHRQGEHPSFIRRMQDWIEVASCYKELRKLANQLTNSLERWFTCILHENIPTTNNLAERQLREIVVQRKIWGTLRNEKGTSIVETIMSLLMTWKMQDVKPLPKLVNLLKS